MPRISVAAPSPTITAAAMEIVASGGNVVDAGVVAALTAMCTEPGVCGPGGGGFLTIDVPGRDPVVIDGYMAYPGKGFTGVPHTRKIEMTYGGGTTTYVDAGSVAVPGALAAFEMASRMFGVAPWRDLMEVVAISVDQGFPLSRPAHLYLTEGAAPIYQSDPVARSALFEDGVAKPEGAPIKFEGLGETLRYIGEEGAGVLYRGDLGKAVSDDILMRGGQLTRRDMEEYTAVARQPLHRPLADFDLILNPEPAVGGVTVARVLFELEIHDAHWPKGLVEALVDAFRERRSGARSPSTISVAAGDDEGGAVAASFSAGYGSGLIPAGTGMLMNNALGEVELMADGDHVPGDRMVSNMAPTVARRHGESIAIGSPGADRITTAVATTLARLARGDTLEEAIKRPRAHPEFGDFGVRVAVEPGPELDSLDLPLRTFDGPHMFFGGVNGAGMLNGQLQAFADARRTGSVRFSD